MIIRPGGLSQASTEDSDKIFIDFERLGHIAREKAGFLVLVTLLGFGLGLTYTLYQFFKPIENRLEIEILFPDSATLMEVTGVKEIDSALLTFQPQIQIQEIASEWPDWSVLDAALLRSDLRRMDSKAKSHFGGNSDLQKNKSSRFFVQDNSGREFIISSGLSLPRNKPVQLVLQGTMSESKLKDLAGHIVFELNRLWTKQALSLAQVQKPNAENVRARLVKEPVRVVDELPQLGQTIQITADLFLLSNYQKIRLIDQFLDKLGNWPDQLAFAHSGKQNWTKLRPSRALAAVPLAVGAGFFIGVLCLLNFFGPLAKKVLGEKDLADVHPAASVYPVKPTSTDLVCMLAASFARADKNKFVKIAAFVPQAESSLLEQVRSAAEKSGRAFSISKENSEKAEVCLFPIDDVLSLIASLPSQGFNRILLSSKKGESLKIQHKLYQAEADLVGIPVTDVVIL